MTALPANSKDESTSPIPHYRVAASPSRRAQYRVRLHRGGGRLRVDPFQIPPLFSSMGGFEQRQAH